MKSSAKSQKKKNAFQKSNPFNMHFNRSKFDVLGQKKKGEVGFPTHSRTKSLRKREKTLLVEYKNRHKNNVFLDRRIGENNAHMDPEKKIMLRAIAQKKQQFSKKNLYNLNEDEVLTHKGIPITEDNIDDREFFSDDDEADDQQGMLDRDYVKSHHFGGGLFVKHDEEKDKKEGLKTRKEWIEEIIAESKKKKADSQKEKEEQRDAVEKLDAKYKDFLQMLSVRTLSEEDKIKDKKNCEFSDYDTIYRQLSLDRSGKACPTDRLKSAEELAKEEEKKLKEYEERRKEKMNKKEISKDKGYSADALDSSYYRRIDKFHHVDDIEENENEDDDDQQDDGSNEEETEDSEEEEEENEEAKQTDSSSLVGEGEERTESGEEELTEDEEQNETEVMEEEEYPEVGDDEEHASSEDDGESLSSKSEEDRGHSTSEGENEEEELANCEEVRRKKGCISSLKKVSFSEDKIAPKIELPSTLQVPTSYDGFWSLIKGRSPTDVSALLDKMCSDVPSLFANKKALCNTLFSFLLKALNDICTGTSERISEEFHPLLYIDPIVPHLHTLVKISPSVSATALTEIINKKFEEYSSNSIKKYPKLDTLVFLKASGLLFPASDYHHQVMTRVLAFLTQMLGDVKPRARRDVCALLFVSFTLIGYLLSSGRFVGELCNALKGVLYLCIPTSIDKVKLPHTPPFSRVGPMADILVLEEPFTGHELPRLTLKCLNDPDSEITNDFKVKALNESLSLLCQLCRTWRALPAVRAIFRPVKALMEALPLNLYPDSTRELFEQLHKDIGRLPPIGRRLVKERGRPTPLRGFDPKIEKVIDGTKQRTGSKEALELQKLQHKVKRERKGVRRELRKDRAFLSRVQLKEVIASDTIRKRKVKMIMGGLSHQEGEFKKLKRKK